MRTSRRRFLRLAAAVSALAGAVPATLARAATRRRPPARPRASADAVPAALAPEIAKQQQSVAQALAAIRTFPLPPGSEPAYRFSTLRSERSPR